MADLCLGSAFRGIHYAVQYFFVYCLPVHAFIAVSNDEAVGIDNHPVSLSGNLNILSKFIDVVYYDIQAYHVVRF